MTSLLMWDSIEWEPKVEVYRRGVLDNQSEGFGEVCLHCCSKQEKKTHMISYRSFCSMLSLPGCFWPGWSLSYSSMAPRQVIPSSFTAPLSGCHHTRRTHPSSVAVLMSSALINPFKLNKLPHERNTTQYPLIHLIRYNLPILAIENPVHTHLL